LERRIPQVASRNSVALPEGTGSSVEKILASVGDMGGGDAPILDKQLKDAQAQIFQLPTVLIGIAIVYNLPDTPGELKLERSDTGGHFLG
jgi:ABC-type phosphate transport system substrate-binding protein